MFDKNSDRIVAIVPFVLVFMAGIIGMKTNVDLFFWWHLTRYSEASPNTIQENLGGDF